MNDTFSLEAQWDQLNALLDVQHTGHNNIRQVISRCTTALVAVQSALWFATFGTFTRQLVAVCPANIDPI